MASIFEGVFEALAPMWVEMSFLLFFGMGFTFLRMDCFTRAKHGGKKMGDTQPVKLFANKLKKTIETEASTGNSEAVLKAWRTGRANAPSPPDTLKLVVHALIDTTPHTLVEEIIEHMTAFRSRLCNERTVVLVLDIVARAGKMEIMDRLLQVFKGELKLYPTSLVYEVLLGGYATAGDEKKVTEVWEEMRNSGHKFTARAYSLTIKGFLKNGYVDAVLSLILDMAGQGLHVPPFAVTQLFRISNDKGGLQETLQKLDGVVVLPPEVVAQLLEDCAKRGDLETARRLEIQAKESKVQLLCGAYDALLKLHVNSADLHALDLFEEMQSCGVRISEGLCVGLLARCADTKFLRFADEVVKYCRAQSGMTIALYSALMKVYAYCGMYDKACDLYDSIVEDGLEPDAMMYGCLMKFAVECGRTQLSQALSEKMPSLDIQNYMALIQAAGRDNDVDRAFQVFSKLQGSGMLVDIAAYNCVLDVCVSARDMSRARKLVQEMKQISTIDIITYNTLLKGYCVMGDVKGAKALLEEMDEAGHPPNDVSFNCLINAVVSRYNGNFQEAWNIIDMMKRRGVAVDHFTISIMMKALKKINNPRDVSRTLELLDSTAPRLDVCADEILLNTVLETCIRHRECRRLENLISAYERSSLRPAVHTYGALIKACSTLKRIDGCWQFWSEMENTRGLQPNDIVLGCMLDALVCNGYVDDAVALLERWKSKVPPNTVMYSTIIKGFTNSHQPERAMTTFFAMRGQKMEMNTVVYNSIIDAQARSGLVDNVSDLFEKMKLDGCIPDSITYSTVVKGYCVKGDLEKAFEILHSMQKNNMAGESIIYNTVLDGCIRHSRMDMADRLLEDMEKYQIAPSNFTLGIMVKMYGRRKQLDKAFEVIETMPRKHGFRPNAQVRTCLMCACLNNNFSDKAYEVFLELKALPEGADARAYSALISGLVRNNRLELAASLVEEAYNVLTNKGNLREPLEQLLRAINQKGLAYQLGHPLVEKLRKAKAPISPSLFSALLGANPEPQGYQGAGHKRRTSSCLSEGYFNEKPYDWNRSK